MTLSLPRLTTFADYLDLHAVERPDADAVWHDGVTLSYRVLRERVDALAAALASTGVVAGDRVAVLSTPRPEYLISLLAAGRIGAVWVGLNPKYTYRELAHVIADSRPRVILSLAQVDGRAYDDDIALLAQEYDVAGAYRLDAGPATGALAVLPDGRALPHHAAAADDAAVIVFTSGSSGTPKGAVLSHRGLVYASVVEAEVLGIDAPRVPCNLPINHVACIADLTGTTLVAGGMLALLEQFDPAEMLACIETLRLTNLMTVPTVLQLLTIHPDFATRDLSSLRWIVWGGAPLPIDVIRVYRERGIGLMTVYGMTETTASITFTDADATDEVLAHTVGRFDPGMRVRLIGDDDREVSPGEQGELQVRHEGLFVEYFGRPEATTDAYAADGWFRTGDIGVVRADGNLRLVGRRSDMIKSGGYNVYPREIELCLESHDDVAQAAVIGRPDDMFGEVGVAYVVAAAGRLPHAEGLREFSRAHLANYKVPKEFVIVDDLPLLPVGKVDKQELRRRASRSASSAGSPSSPVPLEHTP
ncbi:hypothetical protein ASD65_09185 [Microbacterium sp. Root61]|uniref:class I adenylate-forming enzyme family protein n=1 Tax=Microbacterium sp. Root61 TaxID=1736570 RepID=UPI0006F6C058|nr:AMP-binding protein [Microbacterium sp. Root61]KRA24566.1 hypothetical protein ASD65_09185 [Microbacterium sp. Root61]